MTRTRRNRRNAGQVFAIFAVMLTGMLALLGLAIDGGSLFLSRRQMQNAADAAAFAASAKFASGTTDDATLWTTIKDYASRNGVTSPATNTTAYYVDSSGSHIGSALPGNGTAPSNANGIEVTTTQSQNSLLLSIFGQPTILAKAVSAARLVNGYALFATGNGAKAIDWSGGGYSITGSVHTNGGIDLSGTGNTVHNGSVEYVNSFNHQDKLILDSSTVSQTSSQSAPVSYAITDYAPGGSAATAAILAGQYHPVVGNSNLSSFVHSGVMDPGLYYVTGNVNFASPSVSANNVTIVATGSIDVSSGGSTFSPYGGGPLYFANGNGAGGIALNISGSSSAWSGTVYAPNAGVNLSGSADSSLTGGVIANSIKLSGNGLQLKAGSVGGSVSLFK